ncbi:CAIB/BAIF family protein [alpha proteobacterium BAL199]|jgi:crotonobetainyl-CoA:carnitine CoA-transferase CaiB-like acyl-CoA transferase|nr:CAIB/BAIF family protein [alpha proteobacterium BAL199]
MAETTTTAGALAGIRVIDCSRILAGPICTQTLGDLGADIVKIERPGMGDDTRKWGPPFLKDADGQDTSESAYYLSCNRNKRSVGLDISRPEGCEVLLKLVETADVFIENFKVGDMARYGLSFEQLRERFPRLVYASITGFGQTGPYAPRAGYDFLAQGMGGIMSVTGEDGGEPMKVGVAIADVMTGMHTATAILAALRHRDATGRGQYIDAALLDTQVSWLVNQGLNYLVGGTAPTRLGNAHPNITPYQVFATADGHVILGVGNDQQFAKFCRFAGRADIVADPRFTTNVARVRNRAESVATVAAIMQTRSTADWVAGLESVGVPCGPVNDIDQVFADPQVQARGMQQTIPGHPFSPDGVPSIAYPLKLSDTPAEYRRPPPILGQHTEEVLGGELGLSVDELAKLKESGAI